MVENIEMVAQRVLRVLYSRSREGPVVWKGSGCYRKLNLTVSRTGSGLRG